MAYELPNLPYSYDSLEPHVDAETMKLHHSKHHAGYTAKFNAAVEGTEWANKPATEVVANWQKLPENIRGAVRNNGGGYVNHTLFWETMAPGKGGQPEGDLAAAITKTWGSWEKFQETFNNTALTQFGSGWAWLAVKADGTLTVYGTPNQDSPWMNGETPILGLDVWEHAYYKKYGPGRADYANAWWNVVNWDRVAELWNTAKK